MMTLDDVYVTLNHARATPGSRRSFQLIETVDTLIQYVAGQSERIAIIEAGVGVPRHGSLKWGMVRIADLRAKLEAMQAAPVSHGSFADGYWGADIREWLDLVEARA